MEKVPMVRETVEARRYSQSGRQTDQAQGAIGQMKSNDGHRRAPEFIYLAEVMQSEKALKADGLWLWWPPKSSDSWLQEEALGAGGRRPKEAFIV